MIDENAQIIFDNLKYCFVASDTSNAIDIEKATFEIIKQNDSYKDALPLFARLQLTPIIRWQYWRAQRGMTVPIPFASNNPYFSTAPISWDMMYFLPQARQLKEEIDNFTATLPKAVSSRNAKHIAQLQSDLKNTRLELRQKADQLAELHTQLSDREKEISELHSQIENLNVLLCHPSYFKNSGQIQPVETESVITYDNIAELCRIQYTGKLFLSQRAEHSLSKAQFDSPNFVFQALGTLANEYRDWRLGKIPQVDFENKCSSLGITLSAIRRKHKCHVVDPFSINYPPGSQEIQPLQYQLCKGNSKKSRYCIRIYFFWSKQDKLVVVGDLPQQLSWK